MWKRVNSTNKQINESIFQGKREKNCIPVINGNTDGNTSKENQNYDTNRNYGCRIEGTQL